jgi:hypothetical protein
MSNITTDFVRATNKIYAKVSSILADLHLIREDVKVIREQAIDHAYKQANDSNEKQDHAIVTRGGVTDKNSAHEEDPGSESKISRGFRKFKKNLWKDIQKPKSYVEFAALVFLVLYTCQTKRTNDLTQTAIWRSKQQFDQGQAAGAEQFRLDQRPYIWQTPGPGYPEKPNVKSFLPAIGQAPKCGTLYQNYGRSPAIVTRVTGDVEFGPDAARRLRNLPWLDQESIVPPGKSDFVTIDSDHIASPNDRAIIASDGVTCLIQIQYKDTGGNLYETDMCFETNGKDLADYCPAKLGRNRLIDCKTESCER